MCVLDELQLGRNNGYRGLNKRLCSAITPWKSVPAGRATGKRFSATIQLGASSFSGLFHAISTLCLRIRTERRKEVGRVTFRHRPEALSDVRTIAYNVGGPKTTWRQPYLVGNRSCVRVRVATRAKQSFFNGGSRQKVNFLRSPVIYVAFSRRLCAHTPFPSSIPTSQLFLSCVLIR